MVHAALLAMENVVLAPHLGSATRETRTAMIDLAVRNVHRRSLDGRPPLTPVHEASAASAPSFRAGRIDTVMRRLGRAIDGLDEPAVEKIAEEQQEDPFQVLIATMLSAQTRDRGHARRVDAAVRRRAHAADDGAAHGQADRAADLSR